jgi:hypothetical protein
MFPSTSDTLPEFLSAGEELTEVFLGGVEVTGSIVSS